MRKLSEKERARLLRHAVASASHDRYRSQRRRAKRLNRLDQLAERKMFAQQNNVFFDRNLSRVQIILPKILSFKDNYTETAYAINLMREISLNENRPVMLHFSGVEQIDPSAALVLVAEIYRIRNLRSFSYVSGTYPQQRQIYDLLIEMGFFDLLKIEELYGPPKANTAADRSVFLRFISGNRVDAESVDRFVSIVEKHIVPMNAVARGKLVAAIIEAMNNTLDHAHPKSEGKSNRLSHRWWLSSEVNIANREVRILLFDQGVGIPATLPPDRYDRIRALLTRLSPFPTDGDMIMAATELYRTSTGQSGRGRGFRNMKQFVDTCMDGELRVLSNRGFYTYMGGEDACGDEALSIGGTVIEWRFRNDGTVDMEE